jgi:deoxycytidylate deaminase
MEIIQSTKEIENNLNEALKEAEKATCTRSKVGAIIVKDGIIIGRGFNSPPGNLESQRRCSRKSELKPGFKSDKTCCVHAEQRAIIDASQKNPDKLLGSDMYLARLTGDSLKKEFSRPYCTICSKLILDVGIKRTIRLKSEDVLVYEAEEYNDESYNYDGEPTTTN